MRVRAVLALLATLLFAAGCGGGGESAAQAQNSGGPGGGPGGQGRPSGPPVTVSVEPAGHRSMSSYYAATASLDPNKEAEVLAQVSGVIQSITAEEGDRVAKGDLLLRIDDREHKFRLAQAQAEADKQQTRFDRMKKMYEGNLLSAEEFDTAKNDLQAAKAARDLAELELSYTRVTAPFTGRVVRRMVDPGQSVNVSTPLFTVADLDRLLARVHVPAKEFRNIKTDQKVQLVLDSSEEVLEGKITLVSPVIDPATGTIKVTVEVSDYPPDIRPGDFAEVRVVTDVHADALTVPRTAVFAEKSEQVLYVAMDSVAVRRVVEVGFGDGEYTEVLSGLEDGEQVVIQGQRSLKDGARIKIMDKMEFDDSASTGEQSE